MELLRALARDLLSAWIWLMSSLASVLLMAISAVFDWALPTWVFWPVGYVCFWVAAYLAWHKQYSERRQDQQEAQKQLRDLLEQARRQCVAEKADMAERIRQIEVDQDAREQRLLQRIRQLEARAGE